MEHKVYKSPRGNIHYFINEKRIRTPEDADGGKEAEPCFVFCHGLTADHTLFDRQTDYFDKLGRVITWDMPLHGQSVEYKDFSLAAAAEDLKGILEAEEITKAVLVGQSAGGYFAQAFISKYPSAVLAFIGIGTSPLGSPFYKKFDLFLVKHFKAMAIWYPYGYYCRISAKETAVTEAAQKNMYDTLVRLGRKGMLAAGDSLYKSFVKWEKMVEITCPVMLVVGEHDRIGYVRKYNEEWVQQTGYPLLVLEGAGHNANYDGGDRFNRLAEEFLEKNSVFGALK